MAHYSCLLLLLATLGLATGQLLFNPNPKPVAKRPPKIEIEFDSQNQAICPEYDGVYEDTLFCDAYWTCLNGVATESFCEDGLVFDLRKAGNNDPCDSPHVVNCGTRQELQEPSFTSEYCPRRHGSFEHPDPQICNIYYMCVNAKYTEVICASGLYFNSTQGNCNWPHISLRKGCVDKPQVSQDGAFICPVEQTLNEVGLEIPHPSFPNANDCSKFYICLNGIIPQEASCDKGTVFDERSMLCALPETVPECEGWYANDPEFAHYYDLAPASLRNDPGRFDAVGG